MRHVGVVIAGLAAAASACGGSSRPAPAPLTPVTAAPAPPALPTCAPPAQLAVAQVAEDESSRLLVVETATGNVLWQGPAGSGERFGVWSRDGRTLAYAVGEDLIVHDGVRADRLAYRGLAEDGGFAFSRNGHWLAAVGADGVVAIELSARTLASRAVPPALPIALDDCDAETLTWSPDSDRLLVWCESDDGFRLWDPVSRTHAVLPMEDVTTLHGWWSGPTESVVVERDDGTLWRVPLEGEPVGLFGDRLTDDELVAETAVGAAGLMVFSDYDPDEGYPRTLWLAPAAGPPLAWLDGVISDLSFSVDGAWGVFATATDTVDEAGDIYLARVGASAVTRVLAAPVDLDQDLDDVDPDDDTAMAEVYDIGFARPVFRPEPASVCSHALPEARMQLELVHHLDQEVAGLEPGGVVLDENPDAPQIFLGGDQAFALDDSRSWRGARRLANGVVLVHDDAGSTLWLSRAGDPVTTVSRAVGDDAVALGEAGAAWRVRPDALELRGADGAVIATHTEPGGVDQVYARGDGVAIMTTNARVVSLDPKGAPVGSFAARDAVHVIGLAGGDLVTVEPAGEGDGDELVGWRISVMHPRGGVRGRHLVQLYGEVSTLLPLPDGGFVAVGGDERATAFFFDARARLRGSFKLGFAEQPPAVFDDGTVVFVGPAGRDLVMTDSRGRYVGGMVLAHPAVEGPYAVGPDRLVLELEEGIVALERRR